MRHWFKQLPVVAPLVRAPLATANAVMASSASRACHLRRSAAPPSCWMRNCRHGATARSARSSTASSMRATRVRRAPVARGCAIGPSDRWRRFEGRGRTRHGGIVRDGEEDQKMIRDEMRPQKHRFCSIERAKPHFPDERALGHPLPGRRCPHRREGASARTSAAGFWASPWPCRRPRSIGAFVGKTVPRTVF